MGPADQPTYRPTYTPDPAQLPACRHGVAEGVRRLYEDRQAGLGALWTCSSALVTRGLSAVSCCGGLPSMYQVVIWSSPPATLHQGPGATSRPEWASPATRSTRSVLCRAEPFRLGAVLRAAGTPTGPATASVCPPEPLWWPFRAGTASGATTATLSSLLAWER